MTNELRIPRCFTFWVGTLILSGLASAFTGAVGRAGDCLQWVRRTDVGSYGQRYMHAMAYDSDRGVTVFFGGEIGIYPEEAFFNDTQEYDGKQWRQINTAVKPPARSGHAMAYDPVRKKMVMFGGRSYVSGSRVLFSDTWVYSGDGINGFWQLQQGITVPPTTTQHAIVWDSVNHGILLQSLAGSTWLWNGTDWTSISSGLPALFDYGMAFDSARGIAMMAGGRYIFGDEIDTIWEKPADSGWQNRGPGPSIRAELALAYDERRQRVVMVGGVGESVETGETAYEYAPGQGWIIIPSLPSGQGRAGAKMVYDQRRGCMVLTGGAGGGAPNANSGGRYSDTWELWPSLSISGQPLPVTNEVCTTASFSVGVLGNPPLQFAWLRDGLPLPNDSRYLGAGTPELTIHSLRHADAGNYQLVVLDTCNPPNVVTSRVATLTVTPESEWLLRATNGPSERFGHSMVYDQARHVTVLFGGRTNHNFVAPFNDLWEWNGARWSQRTQNTVSNGWALVSGRWTPTYEGPPVRRADCAMAYDSRRGITVMFGGSGKAPDGSDVYLKDLWEWNGERWFFRATNGPIARSAGSMAYDEVRSRVVLFGGASMITRTGEVRDDQWVWEWDGQRWHTSEPNLIPGPGTRQYGRMIYDAFRKVVVFGPVADSHGYAAFWDWDGSTWTNRAPSAYLSDPVAAAMSGTIDGGFVYDRERRRGLWFGGYQNNPQNRTVLFDGQRWTYQTNATPPPRRGELAMAYDSDRHVMVMFGGSLTAGGALGATNDTWELVPADAPVILEHPTSQVRAAGEPATFRVSAAGHGFVAYQWYFQNTLLPGAQSDSFTVPVVTPSSIGEYFVRVGSQCGSVTSHVATLTMDEKLQLLLDGQTATLLWAPASHRIFESAENITGPWSPIPDAPIPFPIGTQGPARFFRLRRTE